MKNKIYDIAVVGCGHAGAEAALASARLGCKVCVFSMSLESVVNLPCNPSIGGTAKGHLVREIDALGGEMGKVSDSVLLQFRMLNKSKGPAVYSPRAQVDRKLYQAKMKLVIENQKNIHLIQSEIVKIKLNSDNSVGSVLTSTGIEYDVKAVIISTGTFLNSKITVGNFSKKGGPDGAFSSQLLFENLKKIGIKFFRFKTGTPPRVNKNSINFDILEKQCGDEKITPFSFQTKYDLKNKIECYVTYTNQFTHKIINENLNSSPIYSGEIEGVGPRYCPSIEDKVVRFSDKNRHQLFIEPMGLETNEIYIQGLSTCMPEYIQEKIVRSIKGLENSQIMRYAYAIEYNCCDTLDLKSTLEFKNIKGLYGAGQFNCTSGYEEAAAQGLIAGINAARKIQGKTEFILGRNEAYIGVLIDDLVTKGTNEPYRIMTSRSEYRLYLRQDNADIRLMEKGYQIGLISKSIIDNLNEKKEKIANEIKRLEKTIASPSKEVLNFLSEMKSSEITSGIRLSELLKRPEISYTVLSKIDENMPDIDFETKKQVEINIKYEGYIKRQLLQINQFEKLERKKIPKNIDYCVLKGMKHEAIQKLQKIRPESVGQASRISGVSPADILILLIHLKGK
ncbi:MAG: tRNA uridine-5-carboxymethylaminomethyl(34) synthesis enzyme MnmG [Clostridiales bacterium]|jgi:tRNA uridine 5-carboxymethylaminomethyl modification enzyme|nr:tRNA uridine-5-carboxymethylaminomethyl(34) synthesis enzyme MnmG [Clostridiales bacterium]